jgi:hypothetical protein
MWSITSFHCGAAADDPSNMEWQTVKKRAKDRME